ncbi:hypothetical protein IU500_33340 [Nocardia terpenica]|uniref:hypothetical protein n=1 Tax=Nocardia terpenica TaxID=455432 RepID=UPI001895D290|nr:hypothetical protein [Nocardia terpenica]MBF6065334.1 hypothetical protein [Nocardia terpenica]MBF6108906.1 hypothetical protein [Nocardia terpenica]MBF6121749.1 hypothetical protein [Nocardia terpenica]
MSARFGNPDPRPRVAARLHRRARRLIVGFSPNPPPYAEVPAAMVEPEFVHGARANMDLFLHTWRTGELPTTEQMSGVDELAVARVREGVSLTTILGYYRIGAALVWAELERTATEGELRVLHEAAPMLMQYVAMITEQVAVACIGLVGDPAWEQRDHRRAVAEALLRGIGPGNRRIDAGIPVASAFLVAVFVFDDRTAPGEMALLRQQIERLPGTFLRMDAQGWTALVPLATGDTGDGEPTAQRLRDHLQRRPAESGEQREFALGVESRRHSPVRRPVGRCHHGHDTGRGNPSGTADTGQSRLMLHHGHDRAFGSVTESRGDITLDSGRAPARRGGQPGPMPMLPGDPGCHHQRQRHGITRSRGIQRPGSGRCPLPGGRRRRAGRHRHREHDNRCEATEHRS